MHKRQVRLRMRLRCHSISFLPHTASESAPMARNRGFLRSLFRPCSQWAQVTHALMRTQRSSCMAMSSRSDGSPLGLSSSQSWSQKMLLDRQSRPSRLRMLLLTQPHLDRPPQTTT